jgi:hypothetical protein
MPDPRVRVDEWVLPSHTQAARVAEGSLDLAIAWIEAADLARLNLAAHLLWYEKLEAVMPRAYPATRLESVPAAEITVLVDVDEASWSSWSRYAYAYAGATEASVTRIEDGGIAGSAFFDHVVRLRRPVLDSPKRHVAPMPPTLTRRPVRSPVPVWEWSLLRRSDDTRPVVARAARTLIDHPRPWAAEHVPPNHTGFPPVRRGLDAHRRRTDRTLDEAQTTRLRVVNPGHRPWWSSCCLGRVPSRQHHAADPLQRAFAALGARLDIIDIARPAMRDVLEHRAMIVRPDLHIAWVADAVPTTEPDALARHVLGWKRRPGSPPDTSNLASTATRSRAIRE